MLLAKKEQLEADKSSFEEAKIRLKQEGEKARMQVEDIEGKYWRIKQACDAECERNAKFSQFKHESMIL